MKHKIALLIFVCLLLVFLPLRTIAQQQTKVLDAPLTKWIMENPETINRLILDAIKVDSPLGRLIDSGAVKLKMIDSTDDSNGSSLGVEYNVSKDLARHDFSSSGPTYNGLVLSVSSKGEAVFDQSIDSDDFLDADFSLTAFRSSGGTVAATDEIALKLNDLEDAAIEATTVDELTKNTAAQEAARIIRSHLSTQTYVELSLVGGVETNQSFTTKQYYYGATIGLDIKAWNPGSVLAQFNFFDYPFAFSRYALGADPVWCPRGSTLPLIFVGIDRVNPRIGDPRSHIAKDRSEFNRFRFESSYRTLVANIKDQPIYFEANLRYYRELGSSEDVESVDLDHYSRYTMSLQFPNGLYVGYSRGRLPLGVQNEQMYSVGLVYSF